MGALALWALLALMALAPLGGLPPPARGPADGPHRLRRALRLTQFRPPGAQEASPLLGAPGRFAGFTSVVDVGAYDCSDYTLAAYQAGYTVWTFELDAGNREACLATLARAGARYSLVAVDCDAAGRARVRAPRPWDGAVQRPHVYLVEAGASDAPGCVRTRGKTLMTYAVPGRGGGGGGGGAPVVPVVPVDAVVPAGESVYVFKSDTQGHETAVLHGARQTLRRAHVVALEYWPLGSLVNGLEPVRSLELLYEEGFACYDTGVHAYNLVSRPSEIHAYTERLLADGTRRDPIGSWDDLICIRE